MNILFVCTGNTCRSAMAEAILRARNLDNVDVQSAGIYAHEGDAMSSNAQGVLQQQNIPFLHTASTLTEQKLEWAHLVLTMTNAHKLMILQAAPQYTTKIYTLHEFTSNSTRDVVDPFGGSRAMYERTYEELAITIGQLTLTEDDI